jgi:hypothetical protein
MTMMALALGEDTISSCSRREAIIDDLINLPGKTLASNLYSSDSQNACTKFRNQFCLLLLFIKFFSSFSILAWRFTNALMHHGVGTKKYYR